MSSQQNTLAISIGCRGIIFKNDLDKFLADAVQENVKGRFSFSNSWLEFTDISTSVITHENTESGIRINFVYPDGDEGSIAISSHQGLVIALPLFAKFSLYYLAFPDRLVFAPSLGEILQLLPIEIVKQIRVSHLQILKSMQAVDPQPFSTPVSQIYCLMQNRVLKWDGKTLTTDQRVEIKAAITKILAEGIAECRESAEWLQFLEQELRRLVPTAGRPVGVELSAGLDSGVVALAALRVFPEVVVIAVRTPENAEVLNRRLSCIEQQYPNCTILVEDAVAELTLLNPVFLEAESTVLPEVDMYDPIFQKLAIKAAKSGVALVLTGQGAEDVLSSNGPALMQATSQNVAPLQQQMISRENTVSTFFSSTTADSLTCRKLTYSPHGIQVVDPFLTKNVYFSLLSVPSYLRAHKNIFVEILNNSFFNEKEPKKDDFSAFYSRCTAKYASYWTSVRERSIESAALVSEKEREQQLVLLTGAYLQKFLNTQIGV